MKGENKMATIPSKGDYNTYIGARYVPIIGGMWNQQTEYEPLTIVMYQGSSYTSKTFVPKGTQIDNTTYWVRTANYDEQVEFYRTEVIQFKKDIDTSEAEYIANVHKAQEEYENKITNQQNKYEESISNRITTEVPPSVSKWLSENVTNPTNPVIDKTLTIEGAAADAKSVGDNIPHYINTITGTNYGDILPDANTAWTNGFYLFNVNTTPSNIPANLPWTKWNCGKIGVLEIHSDDTGNFALQTLTGSNGKVYQRGGFKPTNTWWDWEAIYKSNTKTLIVGDNYTTIQEAINNANEFDTIYIPDGEYNEHVICDKFVYIVGQSRNKTILKYSDADYMKPALWIARGHVSNMTIMAVPDSNPTSKTAYACHIDSRTAQENNSVYFENCIFTSESTSSATIGIGLRNNFELTFNNCSFIGKNKSAFYCHDSYTEGATNMVLNVNSCEFLTEGNDITIKMQTQEIKGNYATCKWTRNFVKNSYNNNLLFKMSIWEPTADNTLPKDNWQGSTDWHNSPLSCMNNIDELNS